MAAPTSAQLAPVDEALESAMQELATALSPNRDDYDKRMSIISRVKEALHGRFGKISGLDVIPYGSFISGMYNSSSDLDIAITGQHDTYALPARARAETFKGRSGETSWISLDELDKQRKANLLRDIGYALASARITLQRDLQFILHARVPIIKFRDAASGLDVDLCLGSTSVGFKAWVVGQLAGIHPAFGGLFRLAKAWCKVHGINDGASHSFNSWCLTLLVVYFLQTYPAGQPLLPPLYQLFYGERPDPQLKRLLQAGGQGLSAEVYEVVRVRAGVARDTYGALAAPPLGELFRAFAERMAASIGALVRDGGRTGASDMRVSVWWGELRQGRFSKRYVLPVEDPFDDTDNPGRTFGTWDSHPNTITYVHDVFRRTAQLLQPASAAAQRPVPAAAVMGHLFGLEPLTKAPDLASRVYGPSVAAWAKGELAGRRPSGEILQELLSRLGSDEPPLTFEAFKASHRVRVLNEDKYKSEEQRAEEEEQKRKAKAAKREREREAKRAKDEARKRLAGEERTAERYNAQDHPPPPARRQQQQQAQQPAEALGPLTDEARRAVEAAQAAIARAAGVASRDGRPPHAQVDAHAPRAEPSAATAPAPRGRERQQRAPSGKRAPSQGSATGSHDGVAGPGPSSQPAAAAAAAAAAALAASGGRSSRGGSGGGAQTADEVARALQGLALGGGGDVVQPHAAGPGSGPGDHAATHAASTSGSGGSGLGNERKPRNARQPSSERQQQQAAGASTAAAGPEQQQRQRRRSGRAGQHSAEGHCGGSAPGSPRANGSAKPPRTATGNSRRSQQPGERPGSTAPADGGAASSGLPPAPNASRHGKRAAAGQQAEADGSGASAAASAAAAAAAVAAATAGVRPHG